jgi:O-antigen ligase
MAVHLARTCAWRGRQIALLYVPLAGSAIALSGSRGGAITAGVTVACAVLWIGRRSRATLVLSMALLAGGLVATVSLVPESAWTRMYTIPAELTGGSFGDRVRIWRAGLDAFVSDPLVGVGAGGFSAAVTPRLGARAVAHNTPLSIAVDLGLVGLVLFGGALASAAGGAARRALDDRGLVWTLLATWAVGSASLTWEYRKTTWLVVLIGAAVAALRPTTGAESRRG